MALSEQEQRLLDEMERSFYQNDADVVSTSPRSGAAVTTRAVVVAFLSVAVGIGVVVAGVATNIPVLGVVGFVLMLAGVVYAFAAPKGGSSQSDPLPTGRPSSKSGDSSDGSFMDKLGNRWDKRQQGE
ncbi:MULTISPECIES: DUF3040 domain-containing protein [unclassified Pseudoclavibacter]|uniref:DUF3040 domain-containing protein n=1 Tax=unclassified Pseudoclavibacter TaxID=2615177 RepID=UPI0012F362CE|nr:MULTISPECIES: DUF3040 domain-containing protein [unclassified Pseudoclavibacter]MBF4458671.1 DUF3040 domain-containing protein [Pseudoclavibacter sp. VKM Ac-2867]VXB16093.1 conserved hypothetical protein [Pseudoclavibacter sp. 8L]